MYRNLSIGKKITLSFGVLLFLLAAAIAFSILSIWEDGVSKDSFYQKMYSQTESLYSFKAEIANSSQDLLAVCVSDTDADYRAASNSFAAFQQSFERLATNELEAQGDELLTLHSKLLSLLAEGERDRALALCLQEYLPLSTQLKRAVNQLLSSSESDLAVYTGKASRHTNAAIGFLLGTGLLGAGAALFLGIRLQRSIAVPLKEISKAAEKLASGELHFSINYQSRDEIGRLSEAMRHTTRMLSGYISDISKAMRALSQGDLNVNPQVEFQGDFVQLRDSILNSVFSFNNALTALKRSSFEIAAGAEQVAAAAQQLSLGASSQASSVQELSANAEEISVLIRANAESAAEGSRKAEELCKKFWRAAAVRRT